MSCGHWFGGFCFRFDICLLAEELGNHEGRLGWGEGSFYEKGTRGRQAHTRHQWEIRWGAVGEIRWGAHTHKGGGTGVPPPCRLERCACAKSPCPMRSDLGSPSRPEGRETPAGRPLICFTKNWARCAERRAERGLALGSAWWMRDKDEFPLVGKRLCARNDALRAPIGNSRITALSESSSMCCRRAE